MYPLRKDTVIDVAAALKEASFRSGDQYLSELRKKEYAEMAGDKGSRGVASAKFESLEAFVMAPARFVERLPLAVANDALELALELTPTMADGAVVLPSDYLGVAGKREGLFVHGRAYYEVT